MATFIAKCPECSKGFEAEREWINQIGECPSCGKEITVQETIRSKTPKIIQPITPADEKPCPFCGETIKRVAVKCKHCQSDLSKEVIVRQGESSDKTILAALLLFWTLGFFSAHRMYADKSIFECCLQCLLAIMSMCCIWVAVMAPFLLVVPLAWSIWMIYDFVMIITGSFTDGKGKKISKWT